MGCSWLLVLVNKDLSLKYFVQIYFVNKIAKYLSTNPSKIENNVRR